MKIFIPLLIAAMFGLSGCATAAKYQAVLDSYSGSDIDVLITSWGPPTSTYKKPNGQTLYTYVKDNGGVVVNNGHYATINNRTCTTTFTVDNANKIIDWRYEGNICRTY